MQWPKLVKSRSSEPSNPDPRDRRRVETVIAIIIAVGGLLQTGQAVESVAQSQAVHNIAHSRIVMDVMQHTH